MKILLSYFINSFLITNHRIFFKSKKYLSIFCITLTFTGPLLAAGTQPPGTGAYYDPYLISEFDHLIWISTTSTIWSRHFTQTDNIDASASATLNPDGDGGYAGFSPIGTILSPFEGTYDGQGFTITGLYINRPESNYAGLFGDVTNAELNNIKMESLNISAYGFVGGLVGSVYENTTISGCTLSGTVTCSDALAGGIIGGVYVDAIISNCSSSVNVQNGTSIGGLAGRFYGQITDCHASGSVNATTDNVGGLIGTNHGQVTRCSATGAVSGQDYLGGLIGWTKDTNINQCFATGKVTGHADIGGLIGYCDNCDINNCYATGNTFGTYRITALACNVYGESEIHYCYAKGTVTGSVTGGITLATTISASANFYDSETTGQNDTNSASPKTTEKMKTLSTFTYAGWDFSIEITNGSQDIWDIDPSGTINDGYPFLGWQNGSDTALPVKLQSFTAKYDKDSIELTWSTACEKDNLGFIIERSTENFDYKQIASYQTHSELTGQGTTSSLSHYRITDANVTSGSSYTYRLMEVSTDGVQTEIGTTSIDVQSIPMTTQLFAAYPNPFNPSTTLKYQLVTDSHVSLIVYDILGCEIKTLVNQQQSAAEYQVEWDGSTNSGVAAPSGTYLVRLQAGNCSSIQKVMMIK